MKEHFLNKTKTYYCQEKNIFAINPSRPDPGQREKFNLKFLFSHFFVVLKAFIKPFEAPKRRVKIKI